MYNSSPIVSTSYSASNVNSLPIAVLNSTSNNFNSSSIKPVPITYGNIANNSLSSAENCLTQDVIPQNFATGNSTTRNSAAENCALVAVQNDAILFSALHAASSAITKSFASLPVVPSHPVVSRSKTGHLKPKSLYCHSCNWERTITSQRSFE